MLGKRLNEAGLLGRLLADERRALCGRPCCLSLVPPIEFGVDGRCRSGLEEKTDRAWSWDCDFV